MNRHILVIDDEEAVRVSLAFLLEARGHEVLVAEDGAKGFALAQKHRPELILTDIIMPGHEGIETIVKIKSTLPHVRVIAMSGGGRVDNKDFLTLADEMGADACIHKPFEAAELEAVIAEAFAQ